MAGQTKSREYRWRVAKKAGSIGGGSRKRVPRTPKNTARTPKNGQKKGEKCRETGSIGGGSLFQAIEFKKKFCEIFALILLILLFILLLSVPAHAQAPSF